MEAGKSSVNISGNKINCDKFQKLNKAQKKLFGNDNYTKETKNKGYTEKQLFL